MNYEYKIFIASKMIQCLVSPRLALNLLRGQIGEGLWAVWLLANYYSYYRSTHVYMLHVYDLQYHKSMHVSV